MSQQHVNTYRRDGDNREYHQALPYHTAENIGARGTVDLAYGNLTHTLLGAEPECAEQSEKDIDEKKHHA